MEFILTFGQKYRLNEVHPTFPAAHPDGWVTIVAEDYDTARVIAIRRLGDQWSGLYSAEGFAEDRRFYPRGELARWTQVRQVGGWQ